MQVVIDIDDKLYNRIKCLEPKSNTMLDVLMRSVQSGTTLPKGHGRLIDADALKNEWKNGFHKKIVDALMNDAPTIIKADKEEE